MVYLFFLSVFFFFNTIFCEVISHNMPNIFVKGDKQKNSSPKKTTESAEEKVVTEYIHKLFSDPSYEIEKKILLFILMPIEKGKDIHIKYPKSLFFFIRFIYACSALISFFATPLRVLVK